MKAIVHNQQGDPSVLRLVDRTPDEPGAGEVRVRIAVSGINPTDWKSRSGSYGAADLGSDFVPNQDGSGTIEAVGPGVDTVKVGDRVWITLAAYERPTGGTAQELTVVGANRVYPLPEGASFELGASIGVPAITAHRALTVSEDGPSRLHPGALAGQTVLIAGGAGAVGHAAIQLARWAGATVITTVSGEAKAAVARAAGAQHVVLYTAPDAVAQIRTIAPDGVDLIVEVAAGQNAALDTAVLRKRGTIAIYANNGNAPFALDIGANMNLNSRYQFVLLYTVGQAALDAAAADINEAIVAGALPVGEDAGLPLHHFSLDQTAEAHAAVESAATGKVLVAVAAG